MADEINLWKLTFRGAAPYWSKGKAVCIGDAAHQMLPHQAQAANMALEDAAVLTSLLSKVKSKEEVPHRLSVLYKVRRNRAGAMQMFSNSPQDSPAQLGDTIREYFEGEQPSESSYVSIFGMLTDEVCLAENHKEFAQWSFGYDLKKIVDETLAAEGIS